MLTDRFGMTARPSVIGRIVTATITLVCVLIVYDGWTNLRLIDVVLVVVGPVVAIVVAHVFASGLVQHIELERPLTGREWLATVGFESRFLLLAVPPAVILVVLDLAGVSLTDAIHVVIWLEALSLTFWAGLAAYRAGLRGRSFALALLAGLIVSGVVLTLLVILEPGQPVQDAVAGPVPRWPPAAVFGRTGGRSAQTHRNRSESRRIRAVASLGNNGWDPACLHGFPAI
jgi:hypothetical protein